MIIGGCEDVAAFFMKRALYNRAFYLMLVFGIVIAFLHIYQDATYFLDMVGEDRVLFTPYQSWIEFGLSSNYRYILLLLLPIISAISFSDTYAKDLQTGYLKAILSKGKMKAYFTGLYVTNFIVAGVTIAIPLLINLYLAFMTLPNIKPDPILDYNPLQYESTLFPNLYYQFPLLHTLFYILLAFIFAGMYATICLSVSLYVKNRFFIVVAAFIIDMFLAIILNMTQLYSWVPASFLTQLAAQPPVSLLAIVTIFLLGLGGSTYFYILGVKRRVIV